MSIRPLDTEVTENHLSDSAGSGIYVTPAIVLKSTNSVGISLLLWAFGSIAGMSALLVWLQLGLSVPKFEVPNRDSAETRSDGETKWEPVPRNGGEKNYVRKSFSSSITLFVLTLRSLNSSINGQDRRNISGRHACSQ